MPTTSKFFLTAKLVVAAILFAANVNAQQQGRVGPLIQTKWIGSSAPYTNMTPMDRGKHSNIGCETVAVAQLMNYHKHPPRGIGQSQPYTTKSQEILVPSVNFEVDYDWDNMLTTYPSNNSGTEQQRNAVALLMYHVGVSQRADFRSSGGVGTGGTPRALIDFFGYDKSLEVHHGSFHSDEAWEKILKAQIDAGLPVFYFGLNKSPEGVITFSHVIIMDGYNSDGKFHFNYGYGGNLDGYYVPRKLPQPMNDDQTILINIKPDEGGVGNNEIALWDFATSQTTVHQNNGFTVTVVLQTVGYFYGGRAGVALVDNNDRIVQVVGERNVIPRHPGRRSSSFEITCLVPETVKAGQYRLRIVIRPGDGVGKGEWKIVTLSAVGNGVPSAIPITVAPESTIYRSPGQDIFDASARGTVADVEHHLDNGADVNAKNGDGSTPLHIAVAQNSDATVVRRLIALGANVNAFDKSYQTPLGVANTPEKKAILRVNGGK